MEVSSRSAAAAAAARSAAAVKRLDIASGVLVDFRHETRLFNRSRRDRSDESGLDVLRYRRSFVTSESQLSSKVCAGH